MVSDAGSGDCVGNSAAVAAAAEEAEEEEENMLVATNTEAEEASMLAPGLMDDNLADMRVCSEDAGSEVVFEKDEEEECMVVHVGMTSGFSPVKARELPGTRLGGYTCIDATGVEEEATVVMGGMCSDGVVNVVSAATAAAEAAEEQEEEEASLLAPVVVGDSVVDVGVNSHAVNNAVVFEIRV